MLPIHHVDEIQDNDPAQIAQPQLPGDGTRRLQVGLEDGFLEVAVPHEAAGVDVHRGHGLGLIDHQITAGLELDGALQSPIDFVLDTVQVKQRPLPRVVLDQRQHFRLHGARELQHLRVDFPGIDANLLHTRMHQIPQGAQRQGQILVDTAPVVRRADLFPQQLPQPMEEGHVAAQIRLAGAFGGSAQYIAAVRYRGFLQRTLEQ